MARQKKVSREVTIALPAGDAPMADLGKMLGPAGVNLVQIKRDYDAATAARRGDIVPVVVTVFEDRSVELRYKTPPTAFLIRKALGLASGSPRPGGQVIAKISRQQLREIAEVKLPDLNTADLEAAMRQVAGTARSMGVLVADD